MTLCVVEPSAIVTSRAHEEMAEEGTQRRDKVVEEMKEMIASESKRAGDEAGLLRDRDGEK